MSLTTEKSSQQRIIPLFYLVGGAIGAVTTLSQLNGTSLDAASAFAWLVLMFQIAVALYGGWQYWNEHAIGYQLLYWLSMSCIPAFTFSAASYYHAFGVGVFPVLSLGGGIGFNFYFRFGYFSELALVPGTPGITIGVNLVAIALLASISRLMKWANIARWPLVFERKQ